MIKRMKPPMHPGIILREEVIKEYGLTVTEAAKLLGVTRSALSDVLNGKAAISAEMAFRIAAVFGGSADIWTRLQMKYQNWFAAEKIAKLKLKSYKPAKFKYGFACKTGLGSLFPTTGFFTVVPSATLSSAGPNL